MVVVLCERNNMIIYINKVYLVPVMYILCPALKGDVPISRLLEYGVVKPS